MQTDFGDDYKYFVVRFFEGPLSMESRKVVLPLPIPPEKMVKLGREKHTRMASPCSSNLWSMGSSQFILILGIFGLFVSGTISIV